MIVGIGTDIVEISRIEHAVSKNSRFLEKVFTIDERRYACQQDKIHYHSLAGMWSAKEAVAKAMGSGFRGFGLKDVEIIRDSLGCPGVRLHGKALNQVGDSKIHISISHSEISAVAFCIIEKEVIK